MKLEVTLGPNDVIVYKTDIEGKHIVYDPITGKAFKTDIRKLEERYIDYMNMQIRTMGSVSYSDLYDDVIGLELKGTIFDNLGWRDITFVPQINLVNVTNINGYLMTFLEWYDRPTIMY